MSRAIAFWFEFASTYSYPAAARVRALVRDGTRFEYRPFLLAPIFKAQGWNDSPFNLYPVKGKYRWRDMERICEEVGLSFRRPTQFPRSGLTAARVVASSETEPWIPDFVFAVYRANFAEDRDISSSGVVSEILRDLGQDSGALIEKASMQSSKETLRARTDEAAALGVFGSPSFTVGQELFWGNERVETAMQWAKRS